MFSSMSASHQIMTFFILQAASHSNLHCISTSRSNVLPALELVKETGHLTRDDQGKAHVVTCGIGGYEYNDQIIDTLDVT